MQAIRSLCSRAILLERGTLVADGPVGEVLTRYAAGQQTSFDVRERSLGNRLNRTRGHARIAAFSISSPGQPERQKWSFNSGDALELDISYEVHQPVDSLDLVVSFAVAGKRRHRDKSQGKSVRDRPLEGG